MTCIFVEWDVKPLLSQSINEIEILSAERRGCDIGHVSKRPDSLVEVISTQTAGGSLAIAVVECVS